VRLVAGGATNRSAAEQLYVSPHTVSTHLRHAFAKLGITSRNELIRIALSRAEAVTSYPRRGPERAVRTARSTGTITIVESGRHRT
jgi:DNA-binding CsgD family transcriptional regulator